MNWNLELQITYKNAGLVECSCNLGAEKEETVERFLKGSWLANLLKCMIFRFGERCCLKKYGRERLNWKHSGHYTPLYAPIHAYQ